MGPYVNTRLQNVIDWMIVGGIISISTLYGISTILPELFGR
jgi:hypothetical protein